MCASDASTGPGGFKCRALLSSKELQDLCSKEAWSEYESSMAGKHTQRLADETDESFLAFCAENTRRCPACQVVIFRHAGCNHMRCRCGMAFDWNATELRIQMRTA
mmetsp:Transcript_23244/g.62342  ORF Transcript_23244/g.62342 Transcript_23244/m.62342 type:complete len:106 (+) Transcript_23244:916-1233(+)